MCLKTEKVFVGDEDRIRNLYYTNINPTLIRHFFVQDDFLDKLQDSTDDCVNVVISSLLTFTSVLMKKREIIKE